MNEHFFARVDALLNAAAKSESEASEFAFMSRNAYGAAKAADSPIGIDFAEGLARLLDVDLHYLITGMGEPRSFIPVGMTSPEGARAVASAAKEAKRFGRDPRAIDLVLSQNPDPRLGAARIYALIERAAAMYAARDARAKKAKGPKRSSSSASLKKARP